MTTRHTRSLLDTEHPYRPRDRLAASSPVWLGLSRCGHALTPAQTEARHWPEEGGRRIRAGAARDQLSWEHSSWENFCLDCISRPWTWWSIVRLRSIQEQHDDR